MIPLLALQAITLGLIAFLILRSRPLTDAEAIISTLTAIAADDELTRSVIMDRALPAIEALKAKQGSIPAEVFTALDTALGRSKALSAATEVLREAVENVIPEAPQ